MNDTYRLQPGDEVRIIAPSASAAEHKAAKYERARQLLQSLGLKVTFAKNVYSMERFDTASVDARLSDLHEAYRDPKVKLVMALAGGWSANALLDGIDWKLIADNPKPLLGYSDLTALVNALYARTGRVQYLGPTLSTLGRQELEDYTVQNLQKVLFGAQDLTLTRSRKWQRGRGAALSKTRAWKVLQPGVAEGVLIGGNLGTFYLLQGTPYQPVFDKPVILLVEDDDEAGKYSAREFDRRLQSLLQLPGVRENLRGLAIGRFQPSSRVTMPDVAYIVQRMRLGDIPVIADVDFGHTMPMLTLPIGGQARLNAQDNQASINLLQ
jgi:muramoyltetrapeptide carboxypeptidase